MPSEINSCEKYRMALTDVAAVAAEPSLELRSHLDACASCRAAFTEEMELFAAIDINLSITANAEVPASLLPRVRAGLVERPASRRFWVSASAGIAVAAVLVVAIVLAHKLGSSGTEPNPQAISAAHNTPSVVDQPATSAVSPPQIARMSRKHSRVGAVKTEPNGDVAGVEVEVILIPAGQKQAVDTLLARIQHGEVEPDLLRAEESGKPLQDLEVSPLAIPGVELKLLPDMSEESGSQNKGTSR